MGGLRKSGIGQKRSPEDAPDSGLSATRIPTQATPRRRIPPSVPGGVADQLLFVKRLLPLRQLRLAHFPHSTVSAPCITLEEVPIGRWHVVSDLGPAIWIVTVIEKPLFTIRTMCVRDPTRNEKEINHTGITALGPRLVIHRCSRHLCPTATSSPSCARRFARSSTSQVRRRPRRVRDRQQCRRRYAVA